MCLVGVTYYAPQVVSTITLLSQNRSADNPPASGDMHRTLVHPTLHAVALPNATTVVSDDADNSVVFLAVGVPVICVIAWILFCIDGA